MKNLLSKSAIIAVIITGNTAFAGETDYLKFSLTNYDVAHDLESTTLIDAALDKEISKNNLGFGIAYGTDFQINDFFLSPEVFLDYVGSNVKDVDQDEIKVNSRVGIKGYAGMQVAEKFNIYSMVGLAATQYDINWKSLSSRKKKTEIAPIYGIGTNYQLNDDMALGLEYNIQSMTLDTTSSKQKYKSKINSLAINLKYNF